MNKPNNSPTPVADQRRLPPVRVKVWRTDGKLAKVHPPDGARPKLVAAAEYSSRHNVERLRERLLVPNTSCRSFAFGRNFRTLHECRARDDRSRGAERRN